jgi:hypothetical protein
MFKALRHLFRCGFEHILRRTRARFTPGSETFPKDETGQNSIARERSVPQAGQVLLGSVLMDLTVLQPQSERKATSPSIEWCEAVQQDPWNTVVPFHKQLRVYLS